MTLILIAVAVIAFFTGIIVGALMVIVIDDPEPCLKEMEDSYQPFE